MPSSTRVGLLAYSTNTGLGVQTWEFAQHMRPDKVLLVDLSAYNHMPLHPERFAAFDCVCCKGFPSRAHIDTFLNDLDVVFVCETPLNYDLFAEARARGIKTVLQPNHEFNDYHKQPNLPMPDLFALPSTWHYDECPDPKMLLRVPVAFERFPKQRRAAFRRFLHIAGRPAVHDRNGTAETIAAFTALERDDVTLTVRIQEGGLDVDDPRITVDTTDVPDYWDSYDGFDVIVMPRKYGGLCLPVNEALASAMPVIMPDVSPNEDVLPREWLVPAVRTGSFQARTEIGIHTSDVLALTAKLDEFASMTVRQVAQARETALDLGRELSWNVMAPAYRDVLRARMTMSKEA